MAASLNGQSLDKKSSGLLASMLAIHAECGPKCRSSQQVGELICAATQSCPEIQVIAWIARHCYAPVRWRDENGRSLLHVAASLGKLQLVDWLLKYKDVAINGKDRESGYSALHRAALYGQIRTLIYLIKQGGNLALVDNNGLTALDHVVSDLPDNVQFNKHSPLEPYVWGTNSNYNLGTEDNTARNYPDPIEHFRKHNISVKKVSLQKFHSAFLSGKGTVYTCGHGRGGRLGIGSETMLLTPKPLQIGTCIDVDLGVDHSIFLTDDGTVYTCGENSFHQLGHQPPPPRLLAPAPVGARGGHKPVPAVGVAAGRYHSVYWTDTAVYTWGLNAGQLGHIKGDKTIVLPKVVTCFAGSDVKVEQVCASDGATVVYTNKGDVVALYGYTNKKLGIRQQNIEKIQVVGGQLDPAVEAGTSSADIDFKLVAGGGTSLRVFILRAGKVSVWEEGRDKNFLACTLSCSRNTPRIVDFSPFRDGLLLVSNIGEAWCASWPAVGTNSKKMPTSPSSKIVNQKFEREPSVVIKLKRIQQVHRAVSVNTDPKGRNFCVLQVCPREALTEVPEVSLSRMKEDLDCLLQEASEHDTVHDTICLVKQQRFAVHSFVVASGSEVLSKQLKFAETLHPTIVEVVDIQPKIFKYILQYIYTKTCDLLKEGPCPIQINEPQPTHCEMNENTESRRNIIEYEGDPSTISAFEVHQKNKKKAARNRTESESTNNKKRTGNNSTSCGQNSNNNNCSNNPLMALQAAAKSLGLYGFSKVIDCFRYSDGKIHRKSTPPKQKLDFSFKNLVELCDVTIETEDGDELYAHKSILVARSEYFRGMFSSGWLESDGESTLKLQMKTEYVECILEYLYKDESKTLSKSGDTEFISNLLVYADHLLIARLKEMCESELCKLISLKNVSVMLDFSSTYQADQLKRSCLQFICINLCPLVENRQLESLEPEVLDELDDYYQKANSRVAYRRMTPMTGYPTREEIEREFAESPLTSDDLASMAEQMHTQSAALGSGTSTPHNSNAANVASNSITGGASRPRRNSSGDKSSRCHNQLQHGAGLRSQRRQRQRQRTSESSLSFGLSSASSGCSDDDDAEVEVGGVTPGLSDSLAGLSVRSNRTSVLDFDIEEKEELEMDSQNSGKKEANWIHNTKPHSRDASFFSCLLAQSPTNSIDPATSSSPLEAGQAVESLSSAEEKNKKSKRFTKLTQKERKRLSLEKVDGEPMREVTSPTKAWSGWDLAATANSSSTVNERSLAEIMQIQGGQSSSSGGKERKNSESSETPVAIKKSSWKQLDLASLDKELSPTKSAGVATPTNPWRVVPTTTEPAMAESPVFPTYSGRLSTGESGSGSFSKIMADDVRVERHMMMVQSKPLHLTQLEEQAIDELTKIYRLQYPSDESIQVQRVQVATSAVPVWRRTNS